MRRPAPDLERFGPVERAVHRATAALVGICVGTGLALYVGPLSVAIGRRALLEWVHVIAGILLPVPFLVGWCSRRFRADVRRLNRFVPEDWQWLRSPDRRSGRIPVGKFNAGQKLNAAFTLGAILVMLGTGSIMRFANFWPVELRTGATFVHDWLSVTFLVVICGHLWFAWRDPVARAGMRTGQVPEGWAAVEHGGWLAEMTAAKTQPPATDGRT
jgi:formate dehydrogenase subunit gamma